MKKIVIIIFTIFILCSCNVSKNTSTWKLENYSFEQVEAYLDSLHNKSILNIEIENSK